MVVQDAVFACLDAWAGAFFLTLRVASSPFPLSEYQPPPGAGDVNLGDRFRPDFSWRP